MASYAFSSTSTSDISTPRSTSPSASVVSGRSSQTSISNKRLSISSARRISATNPMSSVDLSRIEEAMKMASLDTLRGYAQNTYGLVNQYTTTEYVPEQAAAGYQILREPLWNKGE
jgi:malate dehydrogenase (oxaloacetate-decarboxylating)(NADP+)